MSSSARTIDSGYPNACLIPVPTDEEDEANSYSPPDSARSNASEPPILADVEREAPIIAHFERQGNPSRHRHKLVVSVPGAYTIIELTAEQQTALDGHISHVLQENLASLPAAMQPVVQQYLQNYFGPGPIPDGECPVQVNINLQGVPYLDVKARSASARIHLGSDGHVELIRDLFDKVTDPKHKGVRSWSRTERNVPGNLAGDPALKAKTPHLQQLKFTDEDLADAFGKRLDRAESLSLPSQLSILKKRHAAHQLQKGISKHLQDQVAEKPHVQRAADAWNRHSQFAVVFELAYPIFHDERQQPREFLQCISAKQKRAYELISKKETPEKSRLEKPYFRSHQPHDEQAEQDFANGIALQGIRHPFLYERAAKDLNTPLRQPSLEAAIARFATLVAEGASDEELREALNSYTLQNVFNQLTPQEKAELFHFLQAELIPQIRSDLGDARLAQAQFQGRVPIDVISHFNAQIATIEAARAVHI